MFKGSQLSSLRAKGKDGPRLKALREALLAEGVLAGTRDGLVFARDWVFNSPSGAACVLLGRSSNGWVEWYDDSKRALDQIERSIAEAADVRAGRTLS